MLISIITLIAFISNVYGHSWVRCTDYDAAITGGDYNEENCHGWIRDWNFDGITFAQDRGANFQVEIGNGAPLCGGYQLGSTAADDYAADYANSDKLARYTSGSTVRVVWPAKNHANYECFSNIPDTSMKLFMNPNVNPTSDLANTQSSMEANGWTLVKDWQEGCTAGTDGCGFQNCRKFCDDTGAATCFQDFTVPSVSTSGYYTFVWYWIFNPGSPYISCWEAYIDANGETTSPSETSGGSSGGSVKALGLISGYLTQVPYCITGDTYDADSVETFVDSHFEDYDGESEFNVISVEQDTNAYNFTVQFSHGNSETAEIVGTAQELCTSFESMYSGTSCSQCDDMTTYATYTSDGNYHGVYLLFGIIVAIISFL